MKLFMHIHEMEKFEWVSHETGGNRWKKMLF